MDGGALFVGGVGVLAGYGAGQLGHTYLDWKNSPEHIKAVEGLQMPHHWLLGAILFIIALLLGSVLLAGFALGLVIHDRADFPQIA